MNLQNEAKNLNDLNRAKVSACGRRGAGAARRRRFTLPGSTGLVHALDVSGPIAGAGKQLRRAAGDPKRGSQIRNELAFALVTYGQAARGQRLAICRRSSPS